MHAGKRPAGHVLPLFAVLVVLAVCLTVAGCGGDKYTATWKVISISENGTPMPSPTPDRFITIKKSSAAGGQYLATFGGPGLISVGGAGLDKVGDHLSNGANSGGAPFTISVNGDTLTMTQNGHNELGKAVLTVLKAVRQ